MENLGALAVVLAFCLAVFAIAASIVGGWKRNPFLITSGRRAVYSIWLLLTVASGVLVTGLLAATSASRMWRRTATARCRRCISLRRGGAGRRGRCCCGAGCSPVTRRW